MEEYRTIQGDTWDMIAKNEYVEERNLDYLMASNFELLDYFIFPAGIVVKVPELPAEISEDLPSWRR